MGSGLLNYSALEMDNLAVDPAEESKRHTEKRASENDYQAGFGQKRNSAA